MTDMFGYAAPVAPFKDIRNVRPSTAEEKAELCLILKPLVMRCPQRVCNGDVRITREWTAAQKKALKVLSSTRSSTTELQTAISQMRGYL